ncbi:hypothetical protein HDU67_004796 [Dinochytrium kinnereticum]|nr:hypothetical protein HDU67_004796 [Dinochytrium kinnereticum]
MLLSATLLLLPLLASAQSAADPCTDLSNVDVPNLAQVYACYDSFVDERSAELKHIETIKKFMQAYPFADISKNSAQGLYSSKLDIEAELDNIEKEPSKTRFQLYSRINRVLLALNDPGVRYIPSCTMRYTFVQPWHMAPIYTKESVHIKLVDTVNIRNYEVPFWADLSGAAPPAYVNYTVKTIDGVEAVKAVQDFADAFSGVSKNPEARFNSVLYRHGTYYQGKFAGAPGKFYVTDFLGHSASPNRTYVLAPPNGGSEVTVTVPWVAIYDFTGPRTKVRFNDKKSYEDLHCNLPKSSSRTRRDMDGRDGRFAKGFSLTRPEFSGSHHQSGGHSQKAQKASHDRSLGMYRAAAPSTRGPFDLGAPLANETGYGIYMLEDGITGVWVLNSLSVSYTSWGPWLRSVATSLNNLREKGAKKLVIDVTGNQDGNFCLGDVLAQHLLGNTTAVAEQLRMTPIIQSLIKTDFLSFESEGVSTKTRTSFRVITNTTSFIEKTETEDRGSGNSEFSRPFYYCRDPKGTWSRDLESMEPLKERWAPEDIGIVSDGTCMGACGLMVRSIRDAYKVKTFTYGGMSRKPYTPTSGENRDTMLFDTIVELRTNRALNTKDREVLPRAFDQSIFGFIPVTESIIPAARNEKQYPLQWIPQPSDEHVDVAMPYVKASIWNYVAAKMSGRDVPSLPDALPASTPSASTGPSPTAGTGGSTTGTTAIGGNTNSGASSGLGSSVICGGMFSLFVGMALMSV